MSDLVLGRHDRAQALGLLDELADLYVPVYAEAPYNGAPKFGRDRFLSRTRTQICSAGFSLVTARGSGGLAGFAFGFTMAGGRWWANASLPSAEVLAADKFAVIELLVDRKHRGHGVGAALTKALLRDRPERYATLAVVLGADAYDWYLRHRWVKVAEFGAEPPFSDALVLNLRG